ncbi:MAG: PleD family two-component system response regulator [Anaerolineales bacterium]
MTKILCVSHDESVRGLLRIILERNGYECIAASNSQKALEILQTQAIDLIIQNLYCSGGCEFYTYLQQDRHLAGIPMLIITPLHPFDLPPACQPLIDAHYPCDFISMPFCPQTIITKVQTRLRSSRNSASGPISSSYNIDVALKMAAF